MVIGEGKEGRVYRRDAEVIKVFHDGIISDEDGRRLAALVAKFGPPFPAGVTMCKEGDTWVVRYPWFDSEPVHGITVQEVKEYLVAAGRLRVIADNFKLSNLRRRDGRLIYIDVGRHIRAFNRSTFRDVCAKAFALLHSMREDQLVSGFGELRQSGGVQLMPGFSRFYAEVVGRVAGSFWAECTRPASAAVEGDVTLLIKCCAMDSAYLERQIGHIVHRLSHPRRFREVVLSIDSKIGSFLRQHSSGDLESLRVSARRLLAQGVVDRVVEAPGDADDIADVNLRWFGLPSAETHTASGIPVYPQVWAFEQVGTRYVLQADCDVLVCRGDFTHDYLSEMLAAHAAAGVMGVGFNIPQPPSSSARAYAAPVGEFKPEVRLGLFDLMRMRAALPLPNRLSGAHLDLGWYQSLHRALSLNGWSCLRGGDPRTTYIHPLNTAKRRAGFLDRVRRCVESGHVPSAQHAKWDLVEDDSQWVVPQVRPGLLVALIPSHATQSELGRCLASLAGQSDPDFGIAVVEDPDVPARTSEIISLLHVHGLRASVVSGEAELGQLVGPLVGDGEGLSAGGPLVLMLGSDEALMAADAVVQLKFAAEEAGGASAGCFCSSEGLRHSDRFGLGQMYEGEVAEPPCPRPRCLTSLPDDHGRAMTRGYQPSCRTFDVFAETPPLGGNLRPPVMGGFVVWRDRGRDFGP
jgi:hypothetical protein